MKINCIDKELIQILETGYYKIPRFQRPYSWEKDNVNDFWNDAIVERADDYFIGSFVVYKSDQSTYGIVDGQQRLTTITMLLCALRNVFNSEGYSSQANGIHKLIEKKDLDDNSKFILQTESSYPYFQEYIQKFGKPEVDEEIRDEEKNLKIAYNILLKKISDSITAIKIDTSIEEDKKADLILKKLADFRDKVLKLKVIYIELDDEDDAYIVFETLNTRGKDLRPSDLVKNHFTKLIKTKNAKVDLTKDRWNKIRETVEGAPGNIDTDTFLHHEWLSRFEQTTLKTLFPKFKEYVKKSNASEFLNELVKDSTIYRYIHEPSFKKWEKNDSSLMRSLEALQLFRVSQQTPVVLSVLREYELGNLRKKHAAEILEAIEHFHFIFTAVTSQRSSGGIGTMYAKAGRELCQANASDKLNVIRGLKDKLKDKIPSFEEFKINFSEILYTDRATKQKKLVRYTLTKIDRHITSQQGEILNYNLMTLEHIASQSSELQKKHGDKVIGQLGNLIFLSEHVNNRLANKPFEKKKRILNGSRVILDKILLESETWDKEKIQARTNYFADIAYNNIFNI